MIKSSFLSSWVSNLFLFIILFFASSQGKAENTAEQQWTEEELGQLIYRGNKDKLTIYINQASNAELNKPFKINYGRGEISLLSLIIEMKAPELVGSLLKKGANPDGLDSSFKCPLMMAIETRQWNFVKLLLRGGANPSRLISNVGGFSEPVPLFYYILRQNSDETRPFLELAVEFKPALDYTKEMSEHHLDYLAYALMKKPSPEVVKYLLSQGEDPEKMTNHVYGTHYGIFLESSVRSPIDTENKEDMANRQKTLEVLLTHGVKPFPNSGRRHCYDPLYIVQSRLDLLNVLLDKGLDPNKVSCYGRTHLTIAAEIANITIFEALLEAGGKLDSTLITEIIKQKKSNDLISWLNKYRTKPFQQCKSSDCESYMSAFISRSRDRDNSNFTSIIDTLINQLSGNTKALNNSLYKAVVYSNNIRLADQLLKAGADFTVNPSRYWARGLKPDTMSWLIKHKVSPFSNKKPLHELVDLEDIPAKQFSNLLLMSGDAAANKRLLQQWLIANLKLLMNGTSVDYIDLDSRLALASKFSVDINHIKTPEGKMFLPSLINQLIERQDSLDGDVKLIWLIARGALLSKESKSHYIDNAYLRGLFERNVSKAIELAPQSSSETTAFMSLINDNMNNSIEIINLLLSIDLLPNNKTIGLKTLKTLENEDMSVYMYACHYASHKAIWLWIKENVRENNEHLLSLYETCSSVDLPVLGDMQSITKDMRQDWFEMNFSSTNFELLAIQSQDESEITSSGTNIKTIKLEAILFAQLQKLSTATLDATRQTLLELKRAKWKAPDNILEKLVEGLPPYYSLANYSQLILLLTQMGADPTKSIFDSNYSFMVHLPLGLDGQRLYSELYKNLSFKDKAGLWDAYIIRLISTSSNTHILRKKALLTPLAIGFLYVLAELLFLIALITYLIKTRRNPIDKELFPDWKLQAVFWASFGLLTIAVVNVIGIDSTAQKLAYGILQDTGEGGGTLNFQPLVPWGLWLKATLFLLVIQLLALVLLFKRTFIDKNHPAVTFFTGLVFFTLTLTLPVILGILSNAHDFITFPLKPL